MRAITAYKSLQKYSAQEYIVEINLSETQAIIYYVADGSPVMMEQLKNTNIETLYTSYYLKRVESLNSLLQHIAYLEYAKGFENG